MPRKEKTKSKKVKTRKTRKKPTHLSDKEKARKVMKRVHRKILKRLSAKERKKLEQSGGGLSSSGSFGNMIAQLFGFVINTIESVGLAVETAESLISLPFDLGHHLDKPAQPLPQNTPIPI